MHHKGRNKHHFEYWVDLNVETKRYEPVPMPLRYITEMFCDRVGASMIYKKENYTDASALEYFQGGKHYIIMHPETKETIERWLTYLADHGLDQTVKYIKKELRS